MANVLILSLVFPPDQVSTAQIMGDIASDLRQRGRDVTVITTIPHYNPPTEPQVWKPKKVFGRLLQKTRFQGIDVFHTSMTRKGRGVFSRLASYLLFHFLSLLVGLTLAHKPDIILAPSPPLTIALCEWLLAARYRVPFIYIVQEIFPDILIDMGVIRSRRLIKLLLKLEAFIYARAGRVVTITEQMRQRLIEKGVPPAKVVTIPNFVNTDELQPTSKRNAFSLQHRIQDQFVVSYAGNLGPTQSLEDFIEAASILQPDDSIRFLLLGDGILREELTAKVDQLGLDNVLILSYQPYALMPLIYAASDLSLVPQSTEVGATSMPSKVYRIMACARSVLAYADPATELMKLVQEVDCGLAVPVGQPGALAEAIRSASRNRRDLVRMGENGRRYVEAHNAKEIVINRYDQLISELIPKA
jgi:colanic acid biosynthesis glycosyl transferase WcaI